MKKRINTGFMLIAAIAIVVTAVCSMFLFYQILEEQIFDDLKASAHVVSVISPNELSKDITYSLENDGLRITCVDVDGTVLYDSMEDASSMENHKERSDWRIEADSFELTVEVPVNTTATVILPDGKIYRNVGSGIHRFASPLMSDR